MTRSRHRSSAYGGLITAALVVFWTLTIAEHYSRHTKGAS